MKQGMKPNPVESQSSPQPVWSIDPCDYVDGIAVRVSPFKMLTVTLDFIKLNSEKHIRRVASSVTQQMYRMCKLRKALKIT